MLNKIIINNKLIETEEEYNSYIIHTPLSIECSECNNIFKFVILKEHYITKLYCCKSCSTAGKRNPFYGKNHSIETKNLIRKNNGAKDRTGEKNHRWGKSNYDDWVRKHGKEYADNKKLEHAKRLSFTNSGEKNSFYGKTHTKESMEKRFKTLTINRIKNRDKIIENNFSRLNIKKETLIEYFEYYKNNISSAGKLKKHFNINFDMRTIRFYWLYFNIVSKKELEELSTRNKVSVGSRRNGGRSKNEIKLFNALVEKYTSVHVGHSFKISGFKWTYDIILFDKLLIEYDGYYWHKIKNGNNDAKKTKLAHEKGFILYRVEESNRGKMNLEQELEIIDNIIRNNNLMI